MKIFIALLALAAVACAQQQVPYAILRQNQDIDPQGSYNYNFETENGIKQTEQGVLKSVGESVGNSAQGQYEYISPDGTPVAVRYIADENGFQPQGQHLPVAHPIPELIQKALDYIAAHPTTEQPAKL